MKTVQSAFKFHGGVHPQYNKDLAASKPIEAMPLPKQLVVSMSQHLGAPAKCLVKKGDRTAHRRAQRLHLRERPRPRGRHRGGRRAAHGPHRRLG